MKTVLGHRAKTAICTFITQLQMALKTLQKIKKKIERIGQERDDQRAEEKKTDMAFNFYIVYFEENSVLRFYISGQTDILLVRLL